MTASGISKELQRFITNHISSVERLEVLLLLYQNPTEWWSAAAVSQALYTVPEFAARSLESLASSGVVAAAETSDSVYRYAPQTSQLDQLVRELAAAYKERRVSVITLIYSKYSDTLQTFANAFKIKKEE